MTAVVSLLTRAEALAERYDKVLSALALVWLFVSAADAAGFIDLPELPFVGRNFWIFFGTAWNAAWWGFARPALIRRRDARQQDPTKPG